jgi:hypothetical protein
VPECRQGRGHGLDRRPVVQVVVIHWNPFLSLLDTRSLTPARRACPFVPFASLLRATSYEPLRVLVIVLLRQNWPFVESPEIAWFPCVFCGEMHFGRFGEKLQKTPKNTLLRASRHRESAGVTRSSRCSRFPSSILECFERVATAFCSFSQRRWVRVFYLGDYAAGRCG